MTPKGQGSRQAAQSGSPGGSPSISMEGEAHAKLHNLAHQGVRPPRPEVPSTHVVEQA